MDAAFIGLTISTLGEVLLGVTVLLVHNKVINAHHIDNKVVAEMRREQIFAGLAIALIALGYLFQSGLIT